MRERKGADRKDFRIVTYHRALRLMAKEIDPASERAIEIMSQLTGIVSRWFATHEQDEQIAFLRRLAAEVR